MVWGPQGPDPTALLDVTLAQVMHSYLINNYDGHVC